MPMRETLKESQAFSGFPTEGLSRLNDAARVVSFEPGARLMEQGEPADSLYVIAAGRVRVQRLHPSLGVPLILAELGPGEVVGEMGILEGGARSATVIALDAVHALEVDAESLFEAVRAVPGVARSMLQLLSRRLRDMDEAVEEAVGRLYRQHDMILSSVEEGIFLLDTAGQVTFANAPGAGLLGRSVEELSGRNLHCLVHPDCSTSEDCELAALLVDGSAQRRGDATFFRKDGAAFPVAMVGNPIVDGDRPSGVVVSVRDVTEGKAVERLKDEFVSIVSHELRTPLTSIRGSLGLLASGQLGELPQRAQRMVDIADSNADRLVRLINDLLDIERMQSGKATMERVDANVGDLMRQAEDLMRPISEKAGVRLVVDPLDATLFVDPDRVLQMLTNLLSNAIKFSPEGGRVWLEGERREGSVEIRVRDEGRGIPSAKQGLVFERFQQVDSSDAREKGGTGLGLPICRSIVEQHGGKIWVESQDGHGSTFFFTLPGGGAASVEALLPVPERPVVLVYDGDPQVQEIIQSALQRQGSEAVVVESTAELIRLAQGLDPVAILLDLTAHGAETGEILSAIKNNAATRSVPIASFSLLNPTADGDPGVQGLRFERMARALGGGKILIVEDDDDLAQVLVQTFVQHGVEAHRARTGREAISMAQLLVPDVLVLDLVLPEGDGYAVVDWLRQHNRLRTLPLVVYSAYEVTDEDRQRLVLGQTVFLTKGRVRPRELEDHIVGLLDRMVFRREPAEPLTA